MTRQRRIMVAGAVLGVLCLLPLLPCVQTVRYTERWTASHNTLHWASNAIRLYHEVNGRLPPAVVCAPDGRPLYSWRVLVLPYAEHASLYRQFKLDEPWDSPHNRPLAQTTPRCYDPRFGSYDEPGTTRVQVLVGPGTAFERPGLSWDDFPDGTANTALVVEAGDPVPWSKPGDIAYDPTGPLPRFGAGNTKPVRFLCYEIGRHPGFAVGFADGTTRFVRTATEEPLIRAMVTRNGGKPFAANQLR